MLIYLAFFLWGYFICEYEGCKFAFLIKKIGFLYFKMRKMINKPSQSLPKRILKYTLCTLATVFLLILAGIAFALNTVFSPAKLTPLVLNQARQYLTPTLSADAVELTFFSSFPEFQLHLKNGMISQPGDTLIRFEEIGIGVRPLKYLTKQEIHLGKILFKNADISAKIPESGKPNWDIMKPDTVQQQVTDTTVTAPPVISGIQIDQIAFENVNLHFSDQPNQTQFDLTDLSATIAGTFGKIHNELEVLLSTQNIRFEQQGKLLADKIALGLETRLHINNETRVYETDKMNLDLNGMKAGCVGKIQKDTLKDEYLMDIHLGMNIPSLAELLKLIPKSVIKETADVTTNGDVLVTGSIRGAYGKGIFPVADLKASIDKGSFQYKGMPYGVDQLDMNLISHIDLNQKQASYLHIENFLFKGASSEIQLSGEVTNMLSDPRINGNIVANVDFTSLAKSFPLENDVKMAGNIESKLNGNFALSSIQKKDFGKLGLEGFLKITDVCLESPADSFFVNVRSAGLAFGTNREDQTILQGKNLLNAIVGFDGLNVNTRLGDAQMDSVRMQIKSSSLQDTTAIASMQATIALKSLTACNADSTGIRMKSSKIGLQISPSLQDKQIPQIRSNLKFDSLQLYTHRDKVEMTRAGFDLKSVKGKEYKKQWISEGKVGFASLKVAMKDFALPVSMPASVLSLQKDELVLENASVRIGNSDMALTGKFSNLKNVFFEGGTLMGNYSLQSSFIDCNELIHALNAGTDAKTDAENDSNTTAIPETKPKGETADSMSVFIVPDKVDFTMHTKIDKVQLGKMVIENINGDIIVRNQAIELSGLKMHTLAADMISTLVYRAKDASSAYTGFDVKMKDIQVGRLVELMPALDTLVPMLRSLDGIVNFHVAAETSLNADMSPRIPTIQAAANLRGDSLVLMDGQTFTEISKMLRFKNKEKNVIDSVSVDMIVRNGQIEIYPFCITMDRYMAAVGGKHNLDMSFNYHVSLLQSPIPFRVGVDVKGNIDDFKFRICKPKYKDMRSIIRTSPVDSTSSTLRQRIKHVLETIE